MTSVFYDVIRLEAVRGGLNVFIEGHFWRFGGEFEPNMLSAIVWTPQKHFLTSQRVFWDISREIPCSGCFSRRVRGIKIKKRGLIFHVFRQALPYGRLAQSLGYVFVSWTQSIMQSFIVICSGVWILWGVEVWPFPLDCDVAVNTAWN